MKPEYWAYLRMATAAHYRAGGPSDGYGNITEITPATAADIETEALQYADREEFDEMVFFIGCADYDAREALVFVIEAARAICGQFPGLAKALLQMAMEEIS